MPSSNPVTIEPIISIARHLSPKSVLDIGTGYGNDHEIHVSKWETKDLPEFNCLKIGTQLLYLKSNKIKTLENK
jgi:hypothetical protein